MVVRQYFVRRVRLPKRASISSAARLPWEYARGIRCNVVLPGLIHTPTAHATLGTQLADAAELIMKRNEICPTGRRGDAWDVAYASLLLASDRAKCVTCVLLPVDGGMP